jgi:drug/metabolite transporter (DMT)-like permease
VLMKYVTKIGCDKHLLTMYYSIVVSLCSIPILIFRGNPTITLIGLISALVNGISYALANINRLAALKNLPVSIVYPVVRLNVVIIVILLVVFLGETVTLPNILGVILATLSVYFITRGDEK